MKQTIILILVLISISIDGFGQRSTANAVVGYWRLEESSGSVLDETNNSNDGTNNGATTGATGIRNNCYDFDGTNDWVSIPNTTALNPVTITISCWVNTTSSGSIEQIISKDKSSVTSGRVWQLRKDASDVVSFIGFHSGGSVVQITGATDITDGNWHHIVGTIDGALIKLYIDGSEDATALTFTNDLEQGKTNDVLIGRAETGDPGYFDGSIDEILIYPRALSDIEIKYHYNLGNGLLYITENFKNEKIDINEYLAYYAEYYRAN